MKLRLDHIRHHRGTKVPHKRGFLISSPRLPFCSIDDQLSGLHYEPHEDYRCTVTLMSGLPGSGKDTWLIQNRPELPVVALDHPSWTSMRQITRGK